MGHHPPTGAQQVADVANSGGLSLFPWLVIIIGIIVVVYIIAKTLKRD